MFLFFQIDHQEKHSNALICNSSPAHSSSAIYSENVVGKFIDSCSSSNPLKSDSILSVLELCANRGDWKTSAKVIDFLIDHNRMSNEFIRSFLSASVLNGHLPYAVKYLNKRNIQIPPSMLQSMNPVSSISYKTAKSSFPSSSSLDLQNMNKTDSSSEEVQ